MRANLSRHFSHTAEVEAKRREEERKVEEAAAVAEAERIAGAVAALSAPKRALVERLVDLARGGRGIANAAIDQLVIEVGSPNADAVERALKKVA